MRLLLIDDSKSSLRALQQTVEGCATTVESYTDPIEAIQRARKTRFDLVVTDFMMPQMDGLEVIKKLRKLDGYAGMPAVVVTSQKDRDLHLALLKASATDILTKPFDKAELRARIENLLALRRSQKKLENENLSLKESVEAAERRSAAHGEEIVWCLARAMASRDGNTGNHVERVAMISELIAQGLGLSDELCRMIFLAAPLHDIGKIGIPDRTLQKPGKLDTHELVEMRKHVQIGVDILQDSTAPIAAIARSIISGHHERWDGTGYPTGLKGCDIPVEARVVAVADVLDALCSNRPYKKAWTPKAAFQEIVACSGTHFDPDCVNALQHKWPEIRPLLMDADVNVAASAQTDDE